MKTPDELQAEYVQVMGKDLGELCYDLRDDWDWLKEKWDEFRLLFLSGEERITLLNTVASNFFYLLQKMMYEDAMLHLCRLTDSKETSKQANVTVLRLHELIADPTLKSSVQAAAEKARQDCTFARILRNKRLAHKGAVAPLTGATSAEVETAMKSINSVLRLVEAHYKLPDAIILGDSFGAKKLLHYLQKGLDAQERSDGRVPKVSG